MRIVVTGGAGFIGRSLVARLRAQRHDVVVGDVNPQDSSGISVLPLDVLDLEQVRKALAGADAVYHLAGPVLERTRSDPFGSTRLQVDGTLNVLEAARVESVPKILLASSFYVYDGLPADGIVNETSRLNPEGMELFGALKLAAEQLVQSYSKRDGLAHVILRFGSAYGAGAGSNLIQTFLDTGLRGEVPEVWGAGLRMNQYTFVDDIARGAVAALATDNEIVNLIAQEETSTGEIALLLREKFGFEVRFRRDRPEGKSMPYMSSRKAVRHLGWEPTPLPAALDTVMERMRAMRASQSRP
jgi:UDP-glucose 4-epimerase